MLIVLIRSFPGLGPMSLKKRLDSSLESVYDRVIPTGTQPCLMMLSAHSLINLYSLSLPHELSFFHLFFSWKWPLQITKPINQTFFKYNRSDFFYKLRCLQVSKNNRRNCWAYKQMNLMTYKFAFSLVLFENTTVLSLGL